MKKILITGAKGFIGSNIVQYFPLNEYLIYGMGHGDISINEAKNIGLNYWVKADINLKNLKELNQKFDVILHFGGSGSVGFSNENPYDDFHKTVNGTLEILEYIRLYNPNVKLIYPSSPAVYGECEDKPIKETTKRNPVSTYGFHKKIVEDLCLSYSKKYDINITVLRLFSVYGSGLKKQLLWDCCNKLVNNEIAEFWGTGNETRDFIHVNDIAKIIVYLIENHTDKFNIINCGSGTKVTVNSVVNKLNLLLEQNKPIKFNNKVHKGNPIFFWSDNNRLNNLVKNLEFKSLDCGFEEYIKWFKLL